MSDAGSRALDEQPKQPDSSYVVSPVPTKDLLSARAKRERPILFSAPMVRALLAGAKTQTRRVVRGGEQWPAHAVRVVPAKDTWLAVTPDRCTWSPSVRCPYGQPGDRLYVRETHAYVGPGSGSTLPSYVEEARDPKNHKPENCWYRADGEQNIVWTPGIHMFRGLSRILLEITDVRVQRLQDISEEDAQAEGLTEDGCACARCGGRGFYMEGGDSVDCMEPGCGDGFVDEYRKLWESINGAGSWSANPWVWAVSFRALPSERPRS